jgi:hypothetical protein
MQMLHLLLADAIWIAFVLAGAGALRAAPAAEGAAPSTARAIPA